MATETEQQQRWKGFTHQQLQAFGARHTARGVEVPYFTARRKLWRTKLFTRSGEPRSLWLGPSKEQIPYGLWRFPREGDAVVICEGESDTIAFALAFPKVPVLGVPGSQSWKSDWVRLFTGFRRVYLSFDGDPAGDGRPMPDKRSIPYSQSLTGRVKADLPHARALMLPDHADTRDILQLLGIDAYKVLIETADRWFESERATEAVNEAFRRRREVEIAFEEASR